MFAKINRINDVEPVKVLEYENYMSNLKDPSPLKTLHKIFQKQKHTMLCLIAMIYNGYMGLHTVGAPTVRHNDNGTVFISGNLQTIYKKFKDKIDALYRCRKPSSLRR